MSACRRGISTSAPPSSTRDEGDRLVGRPLHEQLHLAVLVGRAERAERRGPDAGVARRRDACPGSPPRAARTSRPCRAARRCTASAPGSCRPCFVSARILQRAPTSRRCSSPRSSDAQRVRMSRRAGEQRRRVDPDQRRRQDADRREHAEAAADVRRDLERGDLLAARDGAQRALLRIGDEHEPLARAAPRRATSSSRARTTRYCAIVSAVPPDLEITTNRLRRRSSRAEQRGDVGRIDVVEHVEPRLAAARRVVEQVPLRRPERRAQRDRPERRPADAEHDDVGERVRAAARSHALHVVERLLVQRAVVRAGRGSRACPLAYSSATPRVRRRRSALPTSRHSASVIPPSIGGAIMFV